jgi:hypothetical protein
MKTIDNVLGLLKIGHVAVRTDGAAVIKMPDDRAKKIEKYNLLDRVERVGFRDRIVSPSEFVQVVGCELTIAGKIYKPKGYKKPVKKVLNLV